MIRVYEYSHLAGATEGFILNSRPCIPLILSIPTNIVGYMSISKRQEKENGKEVTIYGMFPESYALFWELSHLCLCPGGDHYFLTEFL